MVSEPTLMVTQACVGQGRGHVAHGTCGPVEAHDMANCRHRTHGRVGAEHPMDITMDPTPTPQVPSGPMTRARAHAIETEVNSLLFELPLHSYETWLLPQPETLCILRYQGSDHGEARKQGQAMVEEEQGKEEEKAAPALQPDDRTATPMSGLNPDERVTWIAVRPQPGRLAWHQKPQPSTRASGLLSSHQASLISRPSPSQPDLAPASAPRCPACTPDSPA